MYKLILMLAAFVFLFSSCKDEDKIAPVITLNGKTPDTLIVKTVASYNDPGATASDDIDGNISSGIVVVSNLNTAVAGSYVIYYNVDDKMGNPAERKTRTVEVVSPVAAYDASFSCTGNSSNGIKISSNASYDTLAIENLYYANDTVYAALNNFQYNIYGGTVSVTGIFTALGTTLNGVFTISGSSCNGTFIRH